MRLWMTSRDSNKPMPRFSDDDVIDFLVTEAITRRAAAAAEKDRAKQERDQWKKGAADLPG